MNPKIEVRKGHPMQSKELEANKQKGKLFKTNILDNYPFMYIYEDTLYTVLKDNKPTTRVYLLSTPEPAKSFFILKIKSITGELITIKKKLQILQAEYDVGKTLSSELCYFAKPLSIQHTPIVESNCQVEILQEFSGESLSSLREKRNGAIDINVIIRWMLQSINALHYMEERAISHWDIKPDNLVYDENDGILKIIDFGCCTELEYKDDEDSKIKRKTKVKGYTLAYAPPEIICIEEKKMDKQKQDSLVLIDSKVDVYCWGLTFYTIIDNKTDGELVAMRKKHGYSEKSYVEFIKDVKSKLSSKVDCTILNAILQCINYKLEERPSFAELFGMFQSYYNHGYQPLKPLLNITKSYIYLYLSYVVEDSLALKHAFKFFTAIEKHNLYNVNKQNGGIVIGDVDILKEIISVFQFNSEEIKEAEKLERNKHADKLIKVITNFIEKNYSPDIINSLTYLDMYYFLLGELYSAKEEFENALINYMTVFSKLEKVEDGFGKLYRRVCFKLGETFLAMKENKNALDVLKKGESLYYKVKDEAPLEFHRFCTCLYDAIIGRYGKITEAELMPGKALGIYLKDQNGYSFQKAYSSYVKGKDCLLRKDYINAITHLSESEKQHLKLFSNNSKPLINIYYGLGSAYHESKNYKKAKEYYTKHLQLNSKENGELNLENASTYENLGNTSGGPVKIHGVIE